MVDEEKKTHWVVEAKASSDYCTRKTVPFVDPFEKPEDVLRRKKRAIMNKIKEQKAAVRQLQENINLINADISKLYEQLDALE